MSLISCLLGKKVHFTLLRVKTRQMLLVCKKSLKSFDWNTKYNGSPTNVKGHHHDKVFISVRALSFSSGVWRRVDEPRRICAVVIVRAGTSGGWKVIVLTV